jgi:hypothetical protein
MAVSAVRNTNARKDRFMFPNGPDQRLWLANQRRRELIHEAEQNRLAGTQTDGPVERRATWSLGSIVRVLSRPLDGIRRAVSGRDIPCTDPAPERAPC